VPSLVLLALIVAVAVVLALWDAYRRDERLAERWAREHHLELTAENRPLVERYVRRARLCRAWGGSAGAVLPSLIDLVVNGRVQVLGFGADGESAPLGFGTIFLGYLVGALWAELSVARPAPAGRRRASLAPRELSGYLPRRAILAQRACAAAAAAGVVAIGVVPHPASFTTPGRVALALAAAVLLIFGAGLEVAERWIVRRPQPFTSAAVVAADDALRAASVQAVAAAGLALLLLACCGAALALQASDVAALRVPMAIAAALCLAGSLLACSGAGLRLGRSRRRAGAPGAASA
jgi:hypothetical protein